MRRFLLLLLGFAPVLVFAQTSPTVTSITSTSAVISWKTDAPSDSVVRFTNDASCASKIDASVCAVNVATGNANTTDHRVIVSGLVSQAVYYFEVNSAPGEVGSFTTLSSTASPILPDLKVGSISISPPSPTVGQLARAAVKITNPSRLAEIANFKPSLIVGLKDGGSDISAEINKDVDFKNLRHNCQNDLLAFGSCTAEFDLIYKTAGKKSFFVTLDNEKLLSEDNEENNSLAIEPFDVLPLPKGDTNPPVILLVVGEPETTRVYVRFFANEEVRVVYEYGTTPNYGLEKNASDLHWVINGAYIENLLPGTTYHVRAKATDIAGNVSYSEDYVFTTSVASVKPIFTVNPKINYSDVPPPVSVTITWKTNVPCDGKVKYGLTDEYGNTASDTYADEHAIFLSDLPGGTAFHYRVSCASSAGTIETVDNIFTTQRNPLALKNSWLASVLSLLSEFFKKLFSL